MIQHPFLKSILCGAMALGLAHSALARDLPARKQTTLYLEFYNQETLPNDPAHVNVPAGEAVILRGELLPAPQPVVSLQWLKNGQPIPGEGGSQFVLGFATPADAGVYNARLTLQGGSTITSQSLMLGVAPAERLVNLSVWNSLPAGLGQGVIAGFVVSGSAQKKMLVRAVGPSLAQFGFAQVLKQPVLRIRDARGNLYENGYVYTPVVGALTYEQDLAESVGKVGAFATLPGAADAVRLLPVAPGSYTVEVVSADASAGAVLLEIYEVP